MDIENLHHAYLVLGPREEARQWIFAQLGELGVSTVGNPDLFVHDADSFGVDAARALGARAQESAFTGRKFFILSPEDVTHQAQNALLKTFEEPVADTHFFLVSREEGLIIPTLRSRMQLLDFRRILVELPNPHASPRLPGPGGQVATAALRDAFSSQSLLSAEKFLDLSLKKRLAFAKKFADDERSLPGFLDELLTLLRSRKEEGLATASKVFELRRYAGDRSSSSRQILEHLALVL